MKEIKKVKENDFVGFIKSLGGTGEDARRCLKNMLTRGYSSYDENIVMYINAFSHVDGQRLIHVRPL